MEEGREVGRKGREREEGRKGGRGGGREEGEEGRKVGRRCTGYNDENLGPDIHFVLYNSVKRIPI